jgi:probable rRNA maturation factor
MPVFFHIQDLALKLSNRKQLKAWLTHIAATEGRKTGEINYIFCSDDYLLNINRTYLKHDTLTDIITFPYHAPEDKFIAGDIYISEERVRENAQKYKVSTENERLRVMAHGLLHLLGYKDKTKAESIVMRAKEDLCLEAWGVERG